MADLGHYYSFNREQSGDVYPSSARWFSFNDEMMTNFDDIIIGDT